MTAYAPAAAPTLDDIRALVDLSACYRFPGDEWRTYDATVTYRGRAYPVGQVTEYDDTARGLLILRHHTLRTAAQRAAWNAITDAFGMRRPESWQTPYAMAPAISY